MMLRWMDRNGVRWDLIHEGITYAVVYPNGVWHTFDRDGEGGENSRELSPDGAKLMAEAAITRQGFMIADNRGCLAIVTMHTVGNVCAVRLPDCTNGALERLERDCDEIYQECGSDAEEIASKLHERGYLLCDLPHEIVVN